MQVKEQVITNFSLRASTYDDYAHVQFAAVNRLAESLRSSCRELVDGPILEIGCGTGFFTIQLIECFSNREIIVSDLSPQMLDKCRERVANHFGAIPQNVKFKIIDGESFEQTGTFALIGSSFTLHWLTNLEPAVTSLLCSLKVGGKLFFSVPSDKCFPEWQKLCQETGVPFTANPLPSSAVFANQANSYQYLWTMQEDSYVHKYSSILHFLRDIKALGGTTSVHKTSLGIKRLLHLINYSNNYSPSSFSITYNVLFGEITKVQ